MNEKDFIKIDIENIEPVDLSDLEKVNIEKNILRSSKKRFNKNFKWMSAIAMTALLVMSSAFWLPAVANRLPIVQQLLQINNHPHLQAFSDFATIINQKDESGGNSIELAEAFFDGNIISISYEMKLDHPMDETPLLWNGQLEVNGNKLDASSHQIIPKDEYTWIGMFTAKATDEVVNETINVQWSPKEFKGIGNSTLVEGDWNYQLELTPTEAYSKTVNIPFGNEQYQLFVNQITVGEYVTTLYFEGNLDWDTEFLMLEIEDDLGNVYENVGVTSTKNGEGQVKGYIEFFVPDTHVQTLMITPAIRIVDGKTLEAIESIPLATINITLD